MYDLIFKFDDWKGTATTAPIDGVEMTIEALRALPNLVDLAAASDNDMQFQRLPNQRYQAILTSKASTMTYIGFDHELGQDLLKDVKPAKKRKRAKPKTKAKPKAKAKPAKKLEKRSADATVHAVQQLSLI